MTTCQQAAAWIPLYIDGELAAPEAALLELHLKECSACRDRFDQLRSVVDNIRAAAPLYEPSPESAQRLRQMVTAEARAARRKWYLVAAAIAVIAIPTSIYLVSRRSSIEFSEFAAASHRRYLSGSAPLDVVTNKPEILSGWFGRRLPFQFKVPDYVDDSGSRKRYSLTGARLLEYRGDDVAYLTYRMNDRPISLLVASSQKISPQGGQVFRSAGIDFHFSSQRGLRLITWKDRALSYALVSDLNVTGAESCVICHGSVAERIKIERLPQ